MVHDVYVSYSTRDKAVADTIVASMEKNNIRCWYQPRDVEQGDNWRIAIFNAIQESKLLLFIFSSSANQTKRLLDELEFAVSKEMMILPFRIEDLLPESALMYYLKSSHWLDAFEPSWESHIKRLIQMVSANLGNLLEEEDIIVPEKIEKKQREQHVQKDNDFDQEEKLLVIDSFEVQGASSQGLIQFCAGDLTKAGPDDNVDVLVISAFRDSYIPTPGSVIGSLYQKGVSVEKLAQNKEVDLRHAFSCWISHEISDPPQGIRFKRILCYEPAETAKSAELVGDIFRSLAPFLGGQFQVHTVATPLVASGFQRVSKKEILEQLVETAVHWISSGLPLNCLKIVCLPDNNINELTRLFSELKARYSNLALLQGNKFSYDLFISYSHKDVREVQMFEQTLFAQQDDLRIFIDRKNLNSGAAWQREIFESIDDSRKVAVFYSPTYLDSKVCIEEFNIALCRHRESDESVLLPIYLYSTNLPTYMRLIQFIDCREFNQKKIDDAALELIRNINS